VKAYEMLAQNDDGKVHYREEGTFVKDDVKKLYYYHFKVLEGTQEIQFIFEYSPRVLKDPEKNRQLIKDALWEYVEEYSEDGKVKVEGLFKWKMERIFDTVYPIRNLLDISFYDTEDNYLGKLNQTFLGFGKVGWLNEKEASLGLTPSKIRPGTWTIEIAVASIVTDKCHYTMEVFLLEEESRPGNKVRKRKRTAVNSGVEKSKVRIEESRWYAGELHVHSNHSDGKNSIDEIIRGAKREGLDFLALTDHDVVSGYDFIPQDKNFPIIKGIEITTFYGHALGLGVKSLINWRRGGEVRGINSIVDEVHAQGALFSIAHPYCIGDPVCAGCRWKFKKTDYRLIDMIEVWCNSWRSRKIENYRSFKLWDKLLNEGLKVTGVSSRDWHDVNKALEYGPIPKTFVYTNSLSEDKLIESLKKGHVFVSSGPMVFFSAEYWNENYICGDEIKASARKVINFTVKVKNLQTFAQLEIIKNGFAFFKKDLPPADKLRVSFSDIPSFEKSDNKELEGSWYRCEIYTKEDKELLCFTNPVSIRLF